MFFLNPKLLEAKCSLGLPSGIHISYDGKHSFIYFSAVCSCYFGKLLASDMGGLLLPWPGMLFRLSSLMYGTGTS